MKKNIDISLLDKAVGIVYNRVFNSESKTIILLGEKVFQDSIWDEYNELVRKSIEDRKKFNGSLLMDIPGVLGINWNWKENKVEVRTDKGYKIYKTGRITMDSLIRRVEGYLK